MKNKIYLTNHSKDRLQQRTDYDAAEYEKLANTAFKKGYGATDFTGKLSDYIQSLCSMQGAYVAKVYDGVIYIFNNHLGHRLLTAYKVPEEYLPISKFLIDSKSLCRCNIILEDKKTKESFYWSVYNDLTEDINDAAEFNNQPKARNFINNNGSLQAYKDRYEIIVY